MKEFTVDLSEGLTREQVLQRMTGSEAYDIPEYKYVKAKYGPTRNKVRARMARLSRRQNRKNK